MIKNIGVSALTPKEKKVIVSILEKYRSDNEIYVINSNASDKKKEIAKFENDTITKLIDLK